jgi:hypothetical protein
VLAVAQPGAHDSAYLSSSSGSNLFTGQGTYGDLQGQGYFVRAVGFGSVALSGTPGGQNQKNLNAIDYVFATDAYWK